MAVVSCTYLPQKADGSGAFRESHVLNETWLVRVDAPPPSTSVMAILTAPGVAYGAAHPSFASCVAMKWNYAAADTVGLAWHVTVQYFVPIVEVNPATGLPMDVWAGKGHTASYPIFQDKDGNVLKNSAGDPLEGMEYEKNLLGWSLTRSYSSLASAVSAINSINNRVNSDEWSWGTAGKWKTVTSGFRKRVIITQSGATQTAARYWEVDFEIDFKEDGWKLKPWDLGFNQRVDSSGTPSGSGTNRATILGIDGKPVRQPVALSGGVALPPGSSPVALEFNAVPSVDYVSFFGVPA